MASPREVKPGPPDALQVQGSVHAEPRKSHDGDLTLLRKWRDGDRESGATLLRSCKAGFYGLCSRLGVRDEEETVEIFQEVVLATLRELQWLPERIVKSFSGWFSWQTRAAITQRRRKLAIRTHELPEIASHEPEPAQAAALREAIRKCSEKLPPVEQQVFTLRFLGGRSLKETADELGSSVNAVGQSIFRLSRKMRACLAASGFEDGEGGVA